MGMAIDMLGRKLSAAIRAKMSAARVGKIWSADVRAKMSNTHKKNPNSGVFKKGHIPSLESRAKVKVSQTLKHKECIESSHELCTCVCHISRKGSTMSQEAREKIAIAVSNLLVNRGFNWPETRLETTLYSFLEKAGFGFEGQVRFGRYIVDAYDPENGLVWEADGDYWHQDMARKERRDGYLLSQGVAAVIHLNETDLDYIAKEWK